MPSQSRHENSAGIHFLTVDPASLALAQRDTITRLLPHAGHGGGLYDARPASVYHSGAMRRPYASDRRVTITARARSSRTVAVGVTAAGVTRAQESAALARVAAVLDEVDNGEHAIRSRDFGRGCAHLARLVRNALAARESNTRATQDHAETL